MRFTTIYYLGFFSVVFFAYWILPKKSRPVFIFLSSFLFYCVWSWEFGIHLLAILFVNFVLLKIIYTKKQKTILVIAILLNVLNLVLFKYFYFLLNIVLGLTGSADLTSANFNSWLEHTTGASQIILPLAISFYTFQLIALQVDAYKGNIPELPTFSHYMMFSMYFPHFVAGPIMRHSDFFYQIENVKPERDKIIQGMFLLAQGLIKKVVIADNVQFVLNPVYENPTQWDGATNALAAVAYSVRVYCDFSGYTDIARGSSKLLGLEIPENFKAPFLSKSVTEFWTRWHVTLMMWMRDYIYIPLGGSRRSELRTHFNIFVAMLVAGLWHGANFTFVAWGLVNGVLVSMERIIRALKGRFFPTASIGDNRIVRFFVGGIQIVYVQIGFLIGCVFFNAKSIHSAMDMWKQILTMGDGERWDHTEYVIYVVIGTFFFNWIQTKTENLKFNGIRSYGYAGAFGALTVILLGAFPPGTKEFIYFQF